MEPAERGIPYPDLCAGACLPSGELDIGTLVCSLEEAWLAAYLETCRHEAGVLRFVVQGFTFLFDHCSATGGDCEDRLVAAHGTSIVRKDPRDASRMRGFLGGGLEIPGKGKFDKGHVLAHAMGGGLDANLFPQRAALNRGRSSQGKLYRRMEKYAATHPGTLVFSRLFYADATWVPTSLEYGILLPEGRLWIEQFEN